MPIYLTLTHETHMSSLTARLLDMGMLRQASGTSKRTTTPSAEHTSGSLKRTHAEALAFRAGFFIEGEEFAELQQLYYESGGRAEFTCVRGTVVNLCCCCLSAAGPKHASICKALHTKRVTSASCCTLAGRKARCRSGGECPDKVQHLGCRSSSDA